MVDAPLRSMLRATGAVQTLTQRRAVWRNRFARMPLVDFAGLAERLVLRALGGDPAARLGALAMASWAIAERRRGSGAVRSLAAALDPEGVLSPLLREAPAAKSMARGGRLPEVSIASAHLGALPFPWIRHDGGPNLHFVRRVLRHPNPFTVRRALNRRWARVEHAITVAARRPVTSEIIDVVLEDRWLSHLTVRQALVDNPFVEGSTVLVLLPTVGPDRWRTTIEQGRSPALVEAAGRLLDQTRVSASSTRAC